MTNNKDERYFGWIAYLLSAILIGVSFVIPPTGVVDPSVLWSAGILIGGAQLLFGHSIKEISIDKTGIHITTHEKQN